MSSANLDSEGWSEPSDMKVEGRQKVSYIFRLTGSRALNAGQAESGFHRFPETRSHLYSTLRDSVEFIPSMVFAGFTVPVHPSAEPSLGSERHLRDTVQGKDSDLVFDVPEWTKDQMAKLNPEIEKWLEDPSAKYAHFLVFDDTGSDVVHHPDCRALDCSGFSLDLGPEDADQDNLSDYKCNDESPEERYTHEALEDHQIISILAQEKAVNPKMVRISVAGVPFIRGTLIGNSVYTYRPDLGAAGQGSQQGGDDQTDHNSDAMEVSKTISVVPRFEFLPIKR